MPHQDHFARSGLLSRIEINQANNSAMTPAENDRLLAEILVERDENPSFALRPLQNGLVTGIGFPIPRPNRIVPGIGERRAGAGRNAGIEQKLQTGESVNAGSTRSRPTRRRA